ncbi:MAG: 50S ribosomal protein L32 [Candidatus Levybacteria bacterium RIFCSPLOWO2_01_FULL_38_21]|nr:MAG: 50S ribosomal protein L32 [Candidatus Levybacteria bacterium RIFCSPLOWO2_01_FULL_38_21]
MPQEPKRRHSRQRKGKRRAGIALRIPSSIICSNCRNTIIPHTLCEKCGYYKGKAVIIRKEKKKKEKDEKSS